MKSSIRKPPISIGDTSENRRRGSGSSVLSSSPVNGMNNEEWLRVQFDMDLLDRKLADLCPQQPPGGNKSSQFVAGLRSTVAVERKGEIDSDTKLKILEGIISRVVELDRAVSKLLKCISHLLRLLTVGITIDSTKQSRENWIATEKCKGNGSPFNTNSFTYRRSTT